MNLCPTLDCASANTGYLFAFRLNAARTDLTLIHPGLQDRVDDRVPFSQNPINTEAAETLLGTNFGSPFAGTIAIELAPAPGHNGGQSPRAIGPGASILGGVPYIATANGRLIRLTRRCPADLASDSLDAWANPNGAVGAKDLDAFIAGFITGNAAIADIASDPLDTGFNPDGSVGPEDLDVFIAGFSAGC